MRMPLLMLLLTLAVSCQGKKDKKDDAAVTAAPTTTPPAETTTPPTTTPSTPAPSTGTTPAAAGWELNAKNCAAWGRGFVEGKSDCVRIGTKEACDALANGSKFEYKYGVGDCVGPLMQASTSVCAGYGQSYDQTSNKCQEITTQAACDALANGSIFDTGYQRCIGVKYLPSASNCAAYGSKYDATKGKCLPISTEAECTALASGAIFDTGYESCVGRCDHRFSILDECFRS